MTAVVLPFPATPRLVDTRARPRLAVGDIVVVCINAALPLWCAWPVAVVDDDGVVIGVCNKAGGLIGADRINCKPEVYGFAARDHDPAGFEALRWSTWTDPAAAVLAFAEIGAARAP